MKGKVLINHHRYFVWGDNGGNPDRECGRD